MKFAATVAAFAAFASTALAQAITVSSPPNFLTCQPNQVAWTGGSGPFFVSVLPGGQSGGTPLADLGEQQSSPYVWNVNVAAGQSVTIRVSDQQGNVQYSSPIPVIAGSSTSCVGLPLTGTTAGSTVAVASSTFAVASSAASSAASAAASSAAASTTGAAATSAASSASSAAASSVVSSVSSSASSAAAATTMMSSSAAGTTSRATTTAAGSSTVAAAAGSSTAANAAATQVIGGAGAVLIGAIGAVAALF